MMRNNLLPIAKEGFSYVLYSLLAFVVFSILEFNLLELLSFVVMAFFVYVFRNPERQSIIYEQNSVVSPVDGKIIAIEDIKDDEEYAYKVTIESNYFDVSLLRTPLNSSVVSMNVKNGSRLSYLSPLSKKINENVQLVFKDNNSNILKVQHTLKQSLTPIDLDIIKNQKLIQGSRYGVMLNGITTLYLPQNFRINVSIGGEVKASQELIGYFS